VSPSFQKKTSKKMNDVTNQRKVEFFEYWGCLQHTFPGRWQYSILIDPLSLFSFPLFFGGGFIVGCRNVLRDDIAKMFEHVTLLFPFEMTLLCCAPLSLFILSLSFVFLVGVSSYAAAIFCATTSPERSSILLFPFEMTLLFSACCVPLSLHYFSLFRFLVSFFSS